MTTSKNRFSAEPANAPDQITKSGGAMYHVIYDNGEPVGEIYFARKCDKPFQWFGSLDFDYALSNGRKVWTGAFITLSEAFETLTR